MQLSLSVSIYLSVGSVFLVSQLTNLLEWMLLKNNDLEDVCSSWISDDLSTLLRCFESSKIFSRPSTYCWIYDFCSQSPRFPWRFLVAGVTCAPTRMRRAPVGPASVTRSFSQEMGSAVSENRGMTQCWAICRWYFQIFWEKWCILIAILLKFVTLWRH